MSYDLAILGNPFDITSDLRIKNEACEGIYKLCQKVLILLFTDSGDTLNLSLGTALPSQTLSGNVRQDYIKNIFNLALDKVKDDLEITYPSSYPDDEKLGAYSVTVLSSDEGSLIVEITLQSVSEEVVSVKVPITHIMVE